ncbi:heat shock protein 24 [Candidatus Blochmanniella pennsylvanica str. BPEN]|uniref:Protein GrpE n=2 Tax=Candidatus Blochmanniella TaxID=203804 RepID=GRPE_BLOPB|nr:MULTISPECIES: nucleotide exchange factor GrpE [Blochmannia]Q492C7.1 RecName: Full=Protein GrpE; AltName: Full=HSP-70 cofactor [Candidatus Blochmannia pennsylvanicus str. BPEN]AAZ41174.1 heat shock protein 24 [Candidatus Blochmannia pennsylvanicus str. BPEN]AGC03819.1 Protein grpE [Candidatus Blochmannia chromaiodes str. 640]UOY04365.1 nucleotide exchange factor GrpE [Candidatus Blochmannia pennsylvanicus]
MIDNNVKNNIDESTLQNEKIEKEELLESVSTVDNVIDPKNDQIIKLKIQLAQLQEHERNTVLRLTAEIENIRRRNTQEIEKIHKFGLERFIFELLPVIDNLERTMSISDNSNTLLSAIIEGIELTLKSFLDTVHKFGLKSIYEINVPFNPEIHQAISIIESEDHKPNQVLTMIQKGYILNGRLIRPAMVTVSQSK